MRILLAMVFHAQYGYLIPSNEVSVPAFQGIRVVHKRYFSYCVVYLRAEGNLQLQGRSGITESFRHLDEDHDMRIAVSFIS